MKSYWYSVVASLLVSACTSEAPEIKPRGKVEATTSDERGERYAIKQRVGKAVAARDFAGLNAMETEFRTRRSRTPSGTWKLAFYYDSLLQILPVRKDGNCASDLLPFVRDWAKADPNQPGPYVAEAAAHHASAWCFRGNGYAREVPRPAMAAFQQRVAAAGEVLKVRRDVASSDPQFYVELLANYTYQGSGEWAFRRLLEEAADREPYYHGIYFAALIYYLPQWYGKPGDIDWLGRFAVKHSAQGEGMGAYARVFWVYDKYHKDWSEVDWPAMKQGMEDVMRAYPNDWNAAHLAGISCSMGQRDTADELIGKLGAPHAWTEALERC